LTGEPDTETSRQRRGTRRTLRRRHVQNWIWLTVMAIAGFTLSRPEWSFHDGPIDRAIDLVGLLLLLLGLGIRVAARGWKHEAPGRNLVTDGLYGYVRHPLYVGSFLIGVGLCAIAGSLWLVGVFCTCFWLSHGAAIRSEEAVLKRQWPAEFGHYRAQVGALWPRWSALRSHRAIRPQRPWEALLREADAICIWLLAAVALELWEKSRLNQGLEQHRPEAVVLIGLALALGLGWRHLRSQAQSLGR
jgi:protein-S-isoprenylcysteine O-methyltransferase Ste14